MHDAFNTKKVSITPPAAIVDNASLTCAAVDTKGYDALEITVYTGATDIAYTALKLTESDDDSSYSDIDGSDYTGAYPSATDDNKFTGWQIDLKGRKTKRYVKPVVTFGDGTVGGYATLWGELSRAEEEPHDKTTKGYAHLKTLPAA